ncbi:MAG TPA: M20/M25/M40 family metallo-hydrolase [Ktedonobacterales bacterium]|nr:M20/M25/M40 family metallo-hydrolase [Ktedonobacterales bacterium]
MATRQRRRRQSAAATTLQDRLAETLIALAGLPSVSGQEGAVHDYIADRLRRLELGQDLAPQTDVAGNLIARVPAFPAARDGEPPLLLNAHMDRVPPGRAHTPVLENGILRSDGATNLGADDSAGIAVILHAVEALRHRGLSHPPLLLLFTVGEEVGLLGAKAFDPEPWGTREGIVFDNAGEAGVAVTRAATYIAFDVILRGRGGHPGKRLEGTASAIEVFRRAQYPYGSLDGDTTRVSIGRIEGGGARNAVPDELRLLGEARTLLGGAERAALLARIERAFVEAASSLGGSAEVSFDPHGEGYEVDPDEPLLRAYAAACATRGQPFRTMTTFIGSDASALRTHTRVVTVSTGAMDEHTSAEWIALAPLAELTETAIEVLSTYHAAGSPRPPHRKPRATA